MVADVPPQRLAFVYLALRQIDATHVLQVQELIAASQCETPVFILPESAALTTYGSTLSGRGGFFFRAAATASFGGKEDGKSDSEDRDEAESEDPPSAARGKRKREPDSPSASAASAELTTAAAAASHKKLKPSAT
jgi:hypothetical protein